MKSLFNKEDHRERIQLLFEQLDASDISVKPEMQLYDWDMETKIYRYSQEEVFELPDFSGSFDLTVEEKGEYIPSDGCSPEEFNMTSREYVIENINVLDREYEQYLEFVREDIDTIHKKLGELINF